jgi:hypothetical protein
MYKYTSELRADEPGI